MKMRSNYLQKEFDVPLQQITLEGREANIIPHDALRDIILNQLSEKSIKYDVADILVSSNHCVMRCTIADNDGRRVQEIGESTADTLETPISKGYPATMAFKRAFDRCAIAYLAFDGKVYSDAEGVTGESKAEFEGSETVDMTEEYDDTAPSANTNPRKENNDGTDKVKKGRKTKLQLAENKAEVSSTADTETSDVAGEGAQPESAAKGNDKQIDGSEIPAEIDREEHAPTSADDEASEETVKSTAANNDQEEFEAVSSVMINIGSAYRNAPVSIATLYATNPGYLRWIAGKYEIRNYGDYAAYSEDVKVQKQACQRFLELKGEQYE